MRYPNLKRSVALVLALSLVACSSLTKKGNQLYESGNYEQAVQMYDQALQKDPSNADALTGRFKARGKLIDTKLIEVRKSRMGGNEQNSIDVLLHLVTLENAWGYFPKGAVAYTQEEESAEALHYIDRQVHDALKQGFPLRAQYWLTHYQPIFLGKGLGGYDGLSALTRDERAKSCRKLISATAAPGPYYFQFLQKFCSGTGVEPPGTEKLSRAKYNELFHKLTANQKIDGVPDEILPVFQDALSNGLMGTPWFDAKGAQDLAVGVNGKFVEKNSEQPEVRIHEYTVQIPYTDYDQVQRQRDVPYQDTDYQCHTGADGYNVCSYVPVTRYKTEYYWETVPVTRYRTEPRSQQYAGTKLYQYLGLFLKARARFGKSPQEISLTEKTENSGFQHDVSMPTIGLYPEKANLPDPLEWIKSQSQLLSAQFQQKADTLWEQTYCKPLDQDTSMAQQGEQVHRCLRRRPTEIPPFVAAWYSNRLGITVAQADELIGIKDY